MKVQGEFINIDKYLKRGCKDERDKSVLSGAHRQDLRQWAHPETQVVPAEHQETFLL